jgi:hypothetical protein
MQTFETCPLSFFYNVTCGENILRDIYFLVFLERENFVDTILFNSEE